uniref:Copine domain-containing protein n=1 Tax=Meloidogyne hapla TaxID=6305 RepID=A0A1I8BJM1_MELHA
MLKFRQHVANSSDDNGSLPKPSDMNQWREFTVQLVLRSNKSSSKQFSEPKEGVNRTITDVEFMEEFVFPDEDADFGIEAGGVFFILLMTKLNSCTFSVGELVVRIQAPWYVHLGAQSVTHGGKEYQNNCASATRFASGIENNIGAPNRGFLEELRKFGIQEEKRLGSSASGLARFCLTDATSGKTHSYVLDKLTSFQNLLPIYGNISAQILQQKYDENKTFDSQYLHGGSSRNRITTNNDKQQERPFNINLDSRGIINMNEQQKRMERRGRDCDTVDIKAGYCRRGRDCDTVDIKAGYCRRGRDCDTVDIKAGYCRRGKASDTVDIKAGYCRRGRDCDTVDIKVGYCRRGKASDTVDIKAGYCRRGRDCDTVDIKAGYCRRGRDCDTVDIKAGYCRRGKASDTVDIKAGYCRRGRDCDTVDIKAGYCRRGRDCDTVDIKAGYCRRGKASDT